MIGVCKCHWNTDIDIQCDLLEVAYITVIVAVWLKKIDRLL